MALIKCPECGEKISDKAPICVHCGYPLARELKKAEEASFEASNGSFAMIICNIGPNRTQVMKDIRKYTSIEVQEVKELLDNVILGETVICVDENIQTLQALAETFVSDGCTVKINPISIEESKNYRHYVEPEIAPTVEVYAPSDTDSGKGMTSHQGSPQAGDSENIPRCPTCGSTDIQKIGAVDGVVSTQFWGVSSKKIAKTYKCNNCGYMW